MSLEINLYAEFLLNVRSVTLYGTLRNRNKTYTKAHVTSDGESISLSYDDQITRIALPLGIKVKGSVGFPVPVDPADLSLRLEILEDTAIPHGLQVQNDLVWSAGSLGTESILACRDCESVITSSGLQWKDLPRGPWAEALDQWYCHRPEVEGVVQSGYTGSQGPQPESGVAFVDTCHFVLVQEDCQNVNKVGEQAGLLCQKCSKQVGILDDQLGGYRLYKWALLLKKTASDSWEKNNVQNLISAQILELMEDQNVRKFLAFSGKISEAESGILLWVFNPDIKYSSSKVDCGRPRRAMKVLYERIDKPSDIADKLRLAVEDLPLPADVLEELGHDLENTHLNLPEAARRVLPNSTMGDWKVALLDRFDT